MATTNTVTLSSRPRFPKRGEELAFRLTRAVPVLVLSYPGTKPGSMMADVYLEVVIISEADDPAAVLRLRAQDWDYINAALRYGISYGHDPGDLASWTVEVDADSRLVLCWI